jgi:hypothetical protein
MAGRIVKKLKTMTTPTANKPPHNIDVFPCAKIVRPIIEMISPFVIFSVGFLFVHRF